MRRGLTDTSVFIARETGRAMCTEAVPDDLAVSIITIGELRARVLSAADLDTRDRRLGTLMTALALEPVPIDERVAEFWARLRVDLDHARLRMPLNDSWIAATAMSLGVPVITQDEDYVDLPGLPVVRV
ncbi:MAG: type II toxin-antitoxin system VapC family toxin [Actinomycetota bacterium]|nr:type II toxin-antitoxin system VapC family toxin [Actinomycetota bacterium]